MHRIADVAFAIVIVAIVLVATRPGSKGPQIIGAIGGAFAGAIRAATGSAGGSSGGRSAGGGKPVVVQTGGHSGKGGRPNR